MHGFKPTKVEGDARIIEAVNWLQVDRVKDLITKEPQLVMAQREFLGGKKLNLIEFLSSPMVYYDYEYNKDAYHQIVKLLLTSSPENAKRLLTDEAFDFARRSKANMADYIELLNSLTHDDQQDECCRYCSSVQPSSTLVRPCNCASLVHAECLQKWFMRRRADEAQPCEICNDRYHLIREPRVWNSRGTPRPDKRLFFPFDDLYPQPWSETAPMLKHQMPKDKLAHAVNYLQTKRLQSLLDQFTKDSKGGGKASLDHHHVSSFLNCEDSLWFHLVRGNLPTNYHSAHNEEAYLQIAEMFLETGLVDLNQKDQFGATALEEATRTEFNAMAELLQRYDTNLHEFW